MLCLHTSYTNTNKFIYNILIPAIITFRLVIKMLLTLGDSLKHIELILAMVPNSILTHLDVLKLFYLAIYNLRTSERKKKKVFHKSISIKQ